MNESSATAKLKFAKKTSKELINLFNSHVRIHANVIQDQLTEFKRNIENICIVEQILHNQLTELKKQQLLKCNESSKVSQLVEKLEVEINSGNEEVTLTTNKLNTLEKEILLLEEHKTKLLQEKAELSSKSNVKNEVPIMIEEIDMLRVITRTHFHKEPQPNIVSGYVQAAGRVQPFSLNTQQYSVAFITNYLWDLMQDDSS